MTGILNGIRVLDLSQGIAGPMASMVLSDNGADVIKIESPDGDPYSGLLGYHAWQRGKRNAIFDLTDSEDKASFLNLVKTVDVLLETYAPGETGKLGISFEDLKKLNPRLVYCSITGYGRDNELSDRPANDALVAARIGLHYEQRGRAGSQYHASGGEIPFDDFEFNPEAVVGPRHEDRDGPLFTGMYWPSIGAAYAAQTAISAALFAREKSGRGQWVETSLLQGALAAGNLAFSYGEKPDAPQFATWINDTRSPKGNFECADGRWIINWVTNPSFVLGASEGDTLNATPDMSAREDPDRIMPAMDDMLVLDHYYPILVDAFKRFDADDWVDAGAVAGQCIQKIRTPEEGLSDPSFIADGCVINVHDEELGNTLQVGTLYSFDGYSSEIKEGIAKSGEHTDEVKAEAAEAAETSIEQSSDTAPEKPLAGVTVLDIGLAIAGPYGAQLLSDLGADVIKVNATYDWYWHSNAIAMSANRGKRSIAVDMRNPAGVEVIQKLAETADVVIHNMRYRAVEGKGLDYEALKKINPRLIYCHTRGFEKGQREGLPGNDQTGSALTGVQWEDGACGNGGRPYWSLTTMGDSGNGYLAAIGIIQALMAREKTGAGQFVDTSIVNAHLFNCSHIIAKGDGSGFDRPQLSNDALGYSSGYRLYKTADDYLCLALSEQSHWDAVFNTIGMPEMSKDSRYDSAVSRSANDSELTESLSEVFATRKAQDLFKVLDDAAVPCEIANSNFSKAMWQDDSFLLKRQWLVSFPHPVVGQVGHVGVAFDFSETPVKVESGPLIVGQQTREILSEFGYSEEQQSALFESKVAADESCYMYPINFDK